MSKWTEIEKKYYMPTFQRMPVVLVRGQGARVWDDNGREYLDFIGGLAVNSLGHCHPVVAKALAKQGKTLTQTSNHFYTVPQLQLAELLVKNSCFARPSSATAGPRPMKERSSWRGGTGNCIWMGLSRSSPRSTPFMVERWP